MAAADQAPGSREAAGPPGPLARQALVEQALALVEQALALVERALALGERALALVERALVAQSRELPEAKTREAPESRAVRGRVQAERARAARPGPAVRRLGQEDQQQGHRVLRREARRAALVQAALVQAVLVRVAREQAARRS